MSDSGMETVNVIGTQTTERHSMGDVTGAWQPGIEISTLTQMNNATPNTVQPIKVNDETITEPFELLICHLQWGWLTWARW